MHGQKHLKKIQGVVAALALLNSSLRRRPRSRSNPSLLPDRLSNHQPKFFSVAKTEIP